MRDGSSELAEIAESRHLRERFPVQPKLPFGAAAFRDERAGDEAGPGQDEHQHLKRHQILRIVAEQLDAGNDAELRQQDPETDALEPGAHRHPHDRQEQHVEQLELLLLGEAEDQRQRGQHRADLQRGLDREAGHGPARQRDQRERRDDDDADDVADPVVQRRRHELGERKQAGHYHDRHVARRDQAGTDHRDEHQEGEIAQRPQLRIEAQRRTQQEQRRRRVAGADGGRRGERRADRQRRRQVDEVGKNRREKQVGDHPPAEQQHQGEAQPGTRIPRRDPERCQRMDEAHPVEKNVAREIGDPDRELGERQQAAKGGGASDPRPHRSPTSFAAQAGIAPSPDSTLIKSSKDASSRFNFA